MNLIKENLATASKAELPLQGWSVVDVSWLVEGEGNTGLASFIKKCQARLNGVGIESGEKLLIVCDLGLVRSSTVASLILENVESVLVKGGIINYDILFSASDKPKHENPVVMVTGGSGFLGKHLVLNVPDCLHPSRKDLDLLSGSAVIEYCRSNAVTEIIHLAHPRLYNLPSTLPEALGMMSNVLEACRLLNIHFVYISSLSIYMKSIYAETKSLCEHLINLYRLKYKVKATILRPGYIYGVGMDKNRLIPKWIRQACKEEPLTVHMYQNGFQTLNLTHVSNVVHSILANLSRNDDYNLGCTIRTDTLKLATTIKHLVKSESVINIRKIESETQQISVPTSEGVSLEQGLQELIDNSKEEAKFG